MGRCFPPCVPFNAAPLTGIPMNSLDRTLLKEDFNGDKELVHAQGTGDFKETRTTQKKTGYTPGGTLSHWT